MARPSDVVRSGLATQGWSVWLIVVACGIGLVAYTDWQVVTDVPLGYLYLVPLALAGSTIRHTGWLLGFVAVAAAFREAFGPFEHSGWPFVLRTLVVASTYALVVILVRHFHNREQRLTALIDEHNRQLSQDIDEAAALQRLLIPRRLPEVDGWSVSARLYPARVVSGDYFDVLWDDATRALMVVVADVAGKGAAAAMLMPVVQATVRRLRGQGLPPEELAASLNETILGLTDRPRFISLVYGILNTGTGDFSYVNLGHPPPLLVKGEITHWLSDGGPIAGAVPGARYDVGREHIDAGDTLVLFTDGVTETENARGELFHEDGVAKTVSRCGDRDAATILDDLHTEVETFRANPATRDDMTLIVLRRHRDPLGP